MNQKTQENNDQSGIKTELGDYSQINLIESIKKSLDEILKELEKGNKFNILINKINSDLTKLEDFVNNNFNISEGYLLLLDNVDINQGLEIVYNKIFKKINKNQDLSDLELFLLNSINNLFEGGSPTRNLVKKNISLLISGEKLNIYGELEPNLKYYAKNNSEETLIECINNNGQKVLLNLNNGTKYILGDNIKKIDFGRIENINKKVVIYCYDKYNSRILIDLDTGLQIKNNILF